MLFSGRELYLKNQLLDWGCIGGRYKPYKSDFQGVFSRRKVDNVDAQAKQFQEESGLVKVVDLFHVEHSDKAAKSFACFTVWIRRELVLCSSMFHVEQLSKFLCWRCLIDER